MRLRSLVKDALLNLFLGFEVAQRNSGESFFSVDAQHSISESPFNSCSLTGPLNYDVQLHAPKYDSNGAFQTSVTLVELYDPADPKTSLKYRQPGKRDNRQLNWKLRPLPQPYLRSVTSYAQLSASTRPVVRSLFVLQLRTSRSHMPLTHSGIAFDQEPAIWWAGGGIRYWIFTSLLISSQLVKRTFPDIVLVKKNP